MTKLEAIQAVEDYAKKIRFNLPEDVRPAGIQIIAIASETQPEIDQIQSEFFERGADPVWYVDRMLKALRAFRDERTAKRGNR